MKRVGKPWFFIVAILIISLTFVAFFGINNYYGDNRIVYVKGAEDIRWGIDIQGGVEAVFAPDIETGSITDENMDAAKEIIETRLVNQNITDSEVYTDYSNKQVIVRFPWKSGESDFDPTAAVQELGETALLTFCEGTTQDTVVLSGAADIDHAAATVNQETGAYVVSLTLTAEGKSKFAEATSRLVNQQISIWMDDTMISAPTVNEAITDGQAMISGSFDADSATELANKINAGSLPFALTVDDSKLQIVSPTLGAEALNVMLIAGAIAFLLVCVLMIIRYRLPGIIASIALLGQVGGMIACVSGFFSGVESFTLTIPGIAGIILSIGMGVDANVIAAERIKEEFDKGKTIDGAIDTGYKNSWSAILDGNVTVIIISVVLMGAFGTPDNPLAWMFSWLSSSITGSIYSFGYTLLIGVIFNFVMGVTATRIMLKSISQFKCMRKPSFYGGAKPARVPKVNFVKNVNRLIFVPAAIALVGIIIAVIFGVNLDINFKGGSRFTFTYENEISVSDFDSAVQENLGREVEVTQSTGISDASSKLVVSLTGEDALSAENQATLLDALQEKFPDNNIALGDSNAVNPTVAHSFFIKALVAVLFAAVFVIIYIGIRFRKIGGISSGMMALMALVIDCFMAFFICVFFRLQIDMNFIAVILTLLGYSLNDTVVIYDRIRENKSLKGDMDTAELVDLSVNQTLSRTIMTSVCTFAAILTVCVVAECFGLSTLRSFAIPMAFGLISGCFTSICISAPMWVKWVEHKKKAKAKKPAKA
ncbi:MAG: protein translocase subunit SecF [Candidatus Howiella sp.]